jgi:outer membrane receptor protein involved in Fe transport
MGDEHQAWHKPKLEISLMTEYNIQDKILLKAELFTRGKMYARIFEEQTSGLITSNVETSTEIKGMADLNLGIEYRYTKVLSGFLNFNNILGQRYYKWYNYPSYRFNMMLGVTYSF